MQQPTKAREVWRTPNGTFAKNPEPVIQAPEPKTKQNDVSLLVPSMAFLMLGLAFWQITLGIATLGTIVYVANKYAQKPKLVINRY